MSGIEMKNGCIFYYGNPAGFINKNRATVDTMFQSKELEEWLAEKKFTPDWSDGVFNRLSKGEKAGDTIHESKPLKQVRIWQLTPDSDFDLRFRSYAEVVLASGEPDMSNYEAVYDGALDTNDLEGIYAKFNLDHPSGFKGHSLSISDVVELYDESGSEYHYVDRFGFQQIVFTEQAQDHGMNMGM